MLELNAKTDAPADLIKDGSEATFMADVVDASQQVPVIVDFWAPWCGPCKALTPALEKAVTAAKGKVRLVKINIDQNQAIAAQLRIQSIPTVYAFFQGQPVDGFQGALGPAELQRFIDKLAGLSGDGDGAGGLAEAIAAAEEMLAQGAAVDAAQTFAAILGEDDRNAAAYAGLARAHLALGDVDQAEAVLNGAPADIADAPEIEAAGPRSRWPARPRLPARWPICGPGSPPTRPTIRRGSIWPPRFMSGAMRARRWTSFWICSAATATGMTGPPAPSC
jgi:putative thioredoxin